VSPRAVFCLWAGRLSNVTLPATAFQDKEREVAIVKISLDQQ